MNADEYLAYLAAQCRYTDFADHMTSEETVQQVNEFHKKHGFSIEYDKESIRRFSLDRPGLAYRQMTSVASTIDLPATEPVTIGYMPLMDFNACATTAPNGELIVLLDVGLDIALHFISLAVLRTNLLLQQGDLESREFRLYFELLLSVYSRFAAAKPERTPAEVFADLNHESLPTAEVSHAAGLKEAMLLFILAHEHAHHCLGHLVEMSVRRVKGAKGDLDLSTFNRSQQQELEADRLGTEIYLRCREAESTYDLHRLESFPHAPLLFFAWLATMEDITAKRGRGLSPDAAATHPPGSIRVKSLKDFLADEHSQLDDPHYRYGDWLFGIFRQWEESEETRRMDPAHLILRAIQQDRAST